MEKTDDQSDGSSDAQSDAESSSAELELAVAFGPEMPALVTGDGDQ